MKLTTLAIVVACGLIGDGTRSDVDRVDPPHLGFFAKVIADGGIPVRAHADVDDAAIRTARDRLAMMLEHMPVAHANLVSAGAELRIVGKDQLVSDMPSMRHWRGRPFQGRESIDARGRGYGGLVTIVSEESILKLPTARHADHRDICVHESAHMIHLFGLSSSVHEAIRQRYEAARDAGLWTDAYAMTNDHEFFAELSMWYFGSRGDYGAVDPEPQEGRAWFKAYDPASFELLHGIYSGALPGERILWTDLERRPPEDEQKLRSHAADERVTVLFINETADDLGLHWLDYEGRRQHYGPLPAGARSSQTTFMTHPWVVVDAGGDVRGVYLPAMFGRVVIR